MKKLHLFTLLMVFSFSATQAQSKFAALAVDRSNGFYYGWAHDYKTLTDAENRAVEECKKKGGNCTVVLSWSGGGCGAYRTISGEVGTAYGWGLASTKDQADAIAKAECEKRSNGKPATNYVWACNTDPAPFKEIQNDAGSSASSASAGNTTLTFNGATMAASGDCPGGNTASLSSDDESFILLINNLPGNGNTNVNANFYTSACTGCVAIQLQDLKSSKIYVATTGTVSRSGKTVNVSVSVKELTDLVDGSGTTYKVSGKIVCED